MRKEFPVVVDQKAEQFDTILFSAGKIGYQVEMNLYEFLAFRKATLAEVTKG